MEELQRTMQAESNAQAELAAKAAENHRTLLSSIKIVSPSASIAVLDNLSRCQELKVIVHLKPVKYDHFLQHLTPT